MFPGVVSLRDTQGYLEDPTGIHRMDRRMDLEDGRQEDTGLEDQLRGT